MASLKLAVPLVSTKSRVPEALLEMKRLPVPITPPKPVLPFPETLVVDCAKTPEQTAIEAIAAMRIFFMRGDLLRVFF